MTAVDLVPGTARLLGTVSAALGTPVTTLAGDALAVPLQDASADTVFAVHLLEHLPRGLDALARRPRCCGSPAAGPWSPCPSRTSRHPPGGTSAPSIATTCDALGAATGLPFTVTEHHGGWLVIDIPR